MKKINVLILFALLLGINACDYVDNPTEGIVIEQIEEPRRSALIIDFTGHRCANCPAGALEASKIAADYPDLVHLVAIHASDPGFCAPQLNSDGSPANADGSFATEWRTPEGNYYTAAYNVFSLPTGNVNGIVVNGAPTYSFGGWRPVVDEVIAQDPVIGFEVETDYDPSSRELKLTADIEALQDLEGEYNITVMLLENNIQDWQKNGSSNNPADPNYPGGDTHQYIHKHVLRMNMNNPAGDEFISGSEAAGFNMSFDFEAEIDQDWVAEEMEALVLVVNAQTLEIMDVTAVDIVVEQ